ncbi:MAG: ATP-binding cassette domain-containing protein [Gemmatimonadota bacterium]|nr:ATP-binding cassette domain-containing protein [Gemmatimonadota bacterium]
MDTLIEPGKATLITGGNAAGRSLLLRVAAGLEPAGARQNRAVIAGLGLTAPSRSAGRRKIGYLAPPGEEMFMGTTVAEELSFSLPGKETDSSTGAAWLKERFGDDFPPAEQNRSVWSLSEGQRRVLALASQAQGLPEVWVCDEPLVLLDGKNATYIDGFLLGETARGAAVLISMARGARLLGWINRVLVLSSGGGVLYSGPPDDVPREAADVLGWFHSSGGRLFSATSGDVVGNEQSTEGFA